MVNQWVKLNEAEKHFAHAMRELVYCNPFLPERIEWERKALGHQFLETRADWNVRLQRDQDHPNVDAMLDRTIELTDRIAEELARGARLRSEDERLYDGLIIFRLYHCYNDRFQKTISAMTAGPKSPVRVAYYPAFEAEWMRLVRATAATKPDDTGHSVTHDPAHLFACLFQVRRAFTSIFHFLVGASKPMVRLRAAAWQSIFTHDLQRYRRVLYDRMGDVTTLITGPSGSGKELVARAIALARFIPFDTQRRAFVGDPAASFYAVNPSALSPTLIESELFGHRRGAFTGAVDDHTGYLEACPPIGTVFLDELGEMDLTIQVKLLRVLQTRTFQRLGETAERQFDGKVIGATNRNLPDEISRGRFREDLYYRLCADQIATPSLAEQLIDRPEDRRELVQYLAQRIVGDEAEALTDEVEQWITQRLGDEYPWPGNVRELDQCVRNVMIRGRYEPARSQPTDPLRQAYDGMTHVRWTAEQLLEVYCRHAVQQTGSYAEAARRLELDRRTVKAKAESSDQVTE